MGKKEAELKLLPCPFCGGEGDLTMRNTKRHYGFFVECVSCRARTEGSAFKNDEYNTKQWNKRHAL
jgi:Lar family restriction alleviation protein